VTRSADVVLEAMRLLDEGASKKSIAKQLGISTHAIRNWASRDRGTLLATHAGAGAHDREACPLIGGLPAAEYAYLLGQYLGDGSIAGHRGGVHRLRISCCSDYPTVMDRVEAAMGAVLPNKVGRLARAGCMDVNSYSKHWPCLFPQHGPGRKHTRIIELRPWQRAIVEREVREFLAGLFHSDGCRVINRVTATRKGVTKTYEYPRYFFENESTDILRICGDALDMVGAEWRFNKWNSISVARRASVGLLDEFIGPKT
jgi:hypothetical protein